MDCGFQLLVGFQIPWTVFRIPKARISHSTSKNFSDSGIRILLHWEILTWMKSYKIQDTQYMLLAYWLTSSLSEDEDAALLAAIMEARVVLFLESLSSHSENNSLNLTTNRFYRFCKEHTTHSQRVVAETVRDRSFLSLDIFPLANLLTCKRKHEVIKTQRKSNLSCFFKGRFGAKSGVNAAFMLCAPKIKHSTTPLSYTVTHQ